MAMIGLELGERVATAVAVHEDGRVLARTEAPVTSDPTAAALSALDAVSETSQGPVSVGVAAIQPEASATSEVLDGLAGRYVGPFQQEGATPAGTAAAVAEAWIGAARGAQDVVYFSVAEHTTGGIVRNGSAWFGARRRAASLAWLALNPVEREDYRKTGCLEAEVAASGIVRRLIWRVKSGDRSRVADVVDGDLTTITVDQIWAAARGGDGVSISIVRDTAKYLGMAASNLVVLIDPEVLVLGGIMASAADLLLEPLRVELARRLPRAMSDALRIETATLGADAAAIGAARLTSVPPS
jgi:predicted NBD/HSP70 family sugar kinase